MSVPSESIIRVTLSYQQANSSLPQTVFIFQNEDPIESDEDCVSDFAAWAENVWAPGWADFASVDVSIIHVGVDLLLPNGHVAYNVGAEVLAIPGTVTGEPMTAATSGYLLGYTSLPKSRGSKYVPGAGKDGAADNKFQSVLLAALLQMLTAYLLGFAGETSATGYVPGILSRLIEEFVPFNGTGYVTDIPAYQRRRKPNVGS